MIKSQARQQRTSMEQSATILLLLEVSKTDRRLGLRGFLGRFWAPDLSKVSLIVLSCGSACHAGDRLSLRSAELILDISKWEKKPREACYHFCYPTPEHGAGQGGIR